MIIQIVITMLYKIIDRASAKFKDIWLFAYDIHER